MINDELNKGVGAAKPLAMEYLRQYCMREMLYGIFYCILAILFSSMLGFAAGKLFWSASKQEDSDLAGAVLCMGTFVALVAILAFWTGSDAGVTHIGHSLAPLPSLLGK